MSFIDQPEQEYGDKIIQEAVQAANPLPVEEPVSLPSPGEGAVPPPSNSAPPPRQANPLLRLPPEVLFRAAGVDMIKTPIEQQYDVGILWQVLAQQATDPVTRSIAAALAGGAQNSEEYE